MRPGRELRELDAWQFTAELDTLTEIYAAAMKVPDAHLPGRSALMERHAAYDSFRAVVARLTAEHGQPAAIIGFAYGFRGSPGQWWHDLVWTSLEKSRGREAARWWLGDAFEIAEVHVRPAHQGEGVGRAMMVKLTAGLAERTAVLSTPDGETVARHLYRRLGFVDLVPGFLFPGSDEPYAIMGAELPTGGPPGREPRSASPSR